MAILLKVDGTREQVTVPEEGSLTFLQGCVGGNIEYVPVLGDELTKQGYFYCYCDEEGKIKEKPVNQEATRLAGRDGSHGFADPLCGDVIFLGEGEAD
jgi:hypothetical protein